MRGFRFAPGTLALGLALSGQPLVSAQGALIARATLRSCTDGGVVGTATFIESPSPEALKHVTVVLSAQNLAEGKHAVHIHEVGACTPCSAAGSHLDLGPFGNNLPVTANHPYHSGDLINVNVGPQGNGLMTHVTNRVSLSPGNLSILDDADGSALVIHSLPDTYCLDPTDPNCAGGGRVACGIIEAAAVAPPTILALTATPNVLWPVNRKLVPVAIGVTVSDDTDPAPFCGITGVTSNEPLIASDSVITGPLSVNLRAERNATGTGRIYSITVTCTNASQLSSIAVVTVLVPHDGS